MSVKFSLTIEVTFNSDEFDDYIEAEEVGELNLRLFASGLPELVEGEWNLSDFNPAIENLTVSEPKLVRK